MKIERARESERDKKNLVTIEGISFFLTFHTGDPHRGTVVIAPDATLTLPEAALPSAAMCRRGRGEDGERRRGGVMCVC